MSTVGCWFAMEDAHVENGCLWYLPGSHKKYPVRTRFVRRNGGTQMIQLEDMPVLDPPAPEEWVSMPVAAGKMYSKQP
jgi:phytanoyl-CoA hydroxylase